MISIVTRQVRSTFSRAEMVRSFTSIRKRSNQLNQTKSSMIIKYTSVSWKATTVMIIRNKPKLKLKHNWRHRRSRGGKKETLKHQVKKRKMRGPKSSRKKNSRIKTLILRWSLRSSRVLLFTSISNPSYLQKSLTPEKWGSIRYLHSL